MKDPYDPSIKEIREWACDKHSIIPVQDWDLMITDLKKVPLFLALSIDPEVTYEKRNFFLACLYLLVGETIRSNGIEHRMEDLRSFIENSSSLQDPTIQKWVSRSQELVKNPDLFDYDKWCNGEWIFVFWDD